MSQLLIQAKSISQHINEYRMLDDQEKYAEKYKTRRERLQLIIDQIYFLHNLAVLLHQNYNIQVQFSSFPHVIKQTKEINEKFSIDVSIIINIGDLYFKQWDSVIEEYRIIIQKYWNLYKQEHVYKKVDNSVLSLLESFDELQEGLTNVRIAQKNLNNLLGTLPPESSIKWEALSSANTKLREAWENLKIDSVPDPIMEFIKKAQLSGASMDSYTPEIKEWLEKHGLKNHFRIKLFS